jgi:tRNA1(Val) A37 N6-methylase TrmN6
MTKAKTNRGHKQQMGQFMTPSNLSLSIIEKNNYTIDSKVLEPSFGEGSFILNQIDIFIKNVYKDNSIDTIKTILKNNIYGCEYDENLYKKCIENIKTKYNLNEFDHNLKHGDFLITKFDDITFDFIDGNPPFGGTINSLYNEKLDKEYGKVNGLKIKKETYSFFVIKSLEMLSENGKLTFICSDTFKTINTMKGLRQVMLQHTVNLKNLNYFSEETTYGMVVVSVTKNNTSKLIYDDKEINLDSIKQTPNFSFEIEEDLIKYFNGQLLSNYMKCSSGMTTGKNEYFVRKIINGKIIEPYKFSYYQRKITLIDELSKANHNFLSEVKENEYKEKEKNGDTVEDVLITPRETPLEIKIPNEDYFYFNKAVSDVLYAKPIFVIYWKDMGKAVITYKKNGNWYLNGVGGKPFFYKEGLTWSLIGSKVNPRYLPINYVLDSGAPIGILNDNVDKDELYFIIGWLNSDLCNLILKKVINHTRNIQSKDVERLPYPFWVSDENKKIAINITKTAIKNKIENNELSQEYFNEINNLYRFN